MSRRFFSRTTIRSFAIVLITVFILSMIPFLPAHAATCVSTGSGNWSSASTWTCAHVPAAADDIQIFNGHTVTMDLASTTINSITLADGNAATTILNIGAGNSLTVSGNVFLVNSNNNATKILSVGAGSLTVGGNLNLTEGAGSAVTQMTVSTGSATIAGNIVINAGGTATNARVIFTGAGTLNAAGAYPAGTTLTTVAGSTVNFNGAAQTIPNYTYNNLTLSGSGVKTLPNFGAAIGGNLTLSGAASATTVGNVTVTNNLNIGSGTTFTVPTATAFTMTVNGSGTSTIGGTLSLNGTGAKVFNNGGDMIIPAGGVYQDSGTGAITFTGNLTNNGTFSSASTGAHTFSGAGKTITAANIISLTNATIAQNISNAAGSTLLVNTLTVNTGFTLTNNGIITVPGILTGVGTGRLTQGANAVLNLGGTTTIPTLTATAAGNVVNYTGAAQTVLNTTYDYLMLSGSGAKTLGGATFIVNNNLSIGTGVQANVTANTGNVHSLTLGGVGQSAIGTWGSTASGATNKNDTYFIGSGRLTVTTADTRATPSITFAAAPTPAYLGGPFTVSATTTNTDSSTLIYSVVSGPCVLLGGSTFNSTGAGNCVVRASGIVTANFEAASNTQTVSIAQAAQATLTASAGTTNLVQGFTTTLSSAGGSGTGSVTFSVGPSTGCTVLGNILTITDASGTCSITAIRAADSNYLQAISSPISFTLNNYQAEINKSFLPTNIAPGTNSVLSITLYSPNPFPLLNAAYIDHLDGIQPGLRVAAGGVIYNGCGGTPTATPGSTTISLSGGNIPAKVGSTNGSCTIQISVTATVAGNLINTIPAGTVSADDGAGKSATNTTPASATLQVLTLNPPSVNKVFSKPTMYAGDNSTLTINLLNQDAVNSLSGVSITDVLPANLTISSTVFSPALTNCGGSASLTAIPGTATISLLNASIPAGVGQTCAIKVNITGTIQGSYINTIPAVSIQTNQGVTNAQAAAATQNIQQMNITKVFAPVTIPAGGTSVATITLFNPSTTQDYTSVGLLDTLPVNMTYVSRAADTCGGSLAWDLGLNQLTFSGGTIPHGTAPTTPGSCTIKFNVTTTATMGTATLTNTIAAGALTDAQNITNPASASANLTVNGAITGTKSFSPTTITQGNPSVATVTLTNNTATAITGVLMTDNLTGGLILYSAAPYTGTTCGGTYTGNAGGTQVTMTNGTIPASSSCVVKFQVTANAPVTQANTIPIGGISGTEGAVGVVSNQAAIASGNLTVQASAVPLTGWKSFCAGVGPCAAASTNTIPVGGTSAMTVSLTAPADTALSNFSYTDNLAGVQPGLTIVNASFLRDAACSGGSLSGISAGSTSFTWSGGSIAAGTQCRITIYVTTSTSGNLKNTLNPGDISNTEGRTLSAAISATLNTSNWQMLKKFTPSTVNPNGISTLSITLTNNYTSDLSNVNLQDNFPANLVVAPTPSASNSCGGTFNPLAGAAVINLVNGFISRQVGATPTICVFTVNVQGTGAAGARVNTINTSPATLTTNANLGGTTVYPQAATTDTLTVANLSITVNKSWPPDHLTVYGGSSSPLTITLTNPNNAPLSGISFTDTMPAGMYLASPVNLVDSCTDASSNKGTFTGAPGSSTFSYLGYDNGTHQYVTLAANTSCTLTMDVSMSVNGTGTNIIPNGAVTTFNGAANPLAAQASLTNLGGVSLSKTFLDNPAVAGSSSRLRLTVLNTGNFALTDLGLSDTLPAGLTIAGSPAASTDCSGTDPNTSITYTANLTATPGTDTITLATGMVGASSSCTVTVPVVASSATCFTNTIPIGNLANDQGYTNSEQARDTVCFLGAPSLTTTPSAAGAIGITLNDTAMLTGGVSPTGNVTFKLYPPADPTCSGLPAYSQVSASAPYGTTPGFVSNALGTWHWTADYAGDSQNSPASSGCAAEPVTVSKASPTITTTASPSIGTVGVNLTAGDSATLVNAFNPTGSVTFTLYSDSSCTSAVTGMSGSGSLSGTTASWSKSWTPLDAGTYYWQASYPGDSNNNSYTSSCTAVNEQIVIGKASPTITSTASPDNGIVGVNITAGDDATLVNAFNPTGSIAFGLYSDPACTVGEAGMNGSTALSGLSASWSKSWTPAAVSTFYWQAGYAGDTNNNPYTSSCTAANEQIVIAKASPSLATVPGAGGTVGTILNDSALLSGGVSPTGSVTFNLYPPSDATCAGAPAYSEVSATAPYATTTGFASDAVGVWHWTADYFGDSQNNPVSSGCAEESVTTIKASPAITSTANPSSGTVGVNITAGDSATLTGAFNPTGSITFTLYSDPACSSAVSGMSGSGSLSGTTASWSKSWTPTAAGTYYWQANYPGDSSNNSYTSSCSAVDEQILIGKVTPSITSTANPASGTVGLSLVAGDSATLVNAYNPTGSVNFTLYSDSTCSIVVSGMSGSGALSGSSASWSKSWTPPAVGTYYWQDNYPGDSNNASYTSSCMAANEQIVIDKANPTLQTTPGAGGIVGAVLNDTASLSAGVTPTGSVTFNLYTPSDPTCASAPAYTEVSAAAPYATAVGFASNAAGTWHWTADYSGDSQNYPTSSGCAAEPVTVSKASPVITTNANPSSGDVGVNLTAGDSASLSNAFNPTGSVSFNLYSDAACMNAVTGMSGSGAISGSTANWSKGWTPPVAGTYYWQASYAGDSNNVGYTSNCNAANEQIIIDEASPTISTIASPSSSTVGVNITAGDSATLVNAFNPTGSVTFTLYSDSSCTSAVTGMSGSGSLSGTTASWSKSWTPLAPGTYYWQASYPGDSNNNSYTSSCTATNEQIVIAQATPTVSTTIHDAGHNPVTSVLLGSTVHDLATVSGGAGTPTGSVIFNYYDNGTCTAPASATSSALALSGGSVAEPGFAQSPAAGGSYSFEAAYSGDTNYLAATSACEPLFVESPSLAIKKYIGTSPTGPWNDISIIVNAGDPVYYRLLVTNTGNFTLGGIAVSDPNVDTTGCTWTDPLGVGANTSCVVGPITALAGTHANTASAHSTETPTDVTDAASYFGNAPAMTLKKYVGPASAGPWNDVSISVNAGDPVYYQILLSNTGNIPLSGLAVSDPNVDTSTCSWTDPLGVGANTSCIIGPVTALAGTHTNTASAHTTQTPTDVTDAASYFGNAPAMAIKKSVGTSGTGPWNDISVTVNVGAPIYYQIVVTNTGNIALHGLTVSDPNVDTSSCSWADPLGIGANTACVIGPITALAGDHSNTASAHSTETPADVTDDASYFGDAPALTIRKSVGSGSTGPWDDTSITVNAADPVYYQIILTNTGNIPLSGLVVSDPTVDTSSCTWIDPLGIGANTSCIIGPVTALVGTHINTASAHSTETPTDVTDNASYTGENPQLAITKSVLSVNKVGPGTYDVAYRITVRNNGTVALSALQVTDDLSATFTGATTSAARSLGSATFAVNWSSPAQPTDYNGHGNNDLLKATDTLAVNAQGTLDLVVRVVPAEAGPFNNVVTATAQPPLDGPITTPSPPAPVRFGPHLFDPPFGVKLLDPSSLPMLTWTMVWINDTNIVAVNATVHDPIPAGTRFPVGGTVTCSSGSPATTTTQCVYDPVKNQVVWSGSLAPDFGVTDPTLATHAIRITFNVIVDAGVSSVNNTASIDSDLNGDGDTTDSGEQQVAQASAGWTATPSTVPSTGFAPGRVSILPGKAESYSDLGDIWVEIPRLGIQASIVGIPMGQNGWDVSWLGNGTGWLNGTAYPGTPGNSVITGHVYMANGKPGPFASINTLTWGDQVIIHMNGQRYIYAVREVLRLNPNDTASMLKHKDLPYVTLITCRGYDQATNSYKYRVAVRAVLLKIEPDR